MTDIKDRKVVDGELFERMILCGAKQLKAHMQTVNDLNVFPIPDGDTGENMYATFRGGLDRLKDVKENSVFQKADALASGMLLNARGNSGVILSQLFYGMALGLKEYETATVDNLADAFLVGVKQAYSSVAKPVEGTMLTVAREAAEYAKEGSNQNTTVSVFIENYLAEMKRSLDRTPELLPVLKEAGVIDSGGAGLVYIAEGFRDAVEGESADGVDFEMGESRKQIDFSAFTEDSVMEYGYCTELLLQLQKIKTDIATFDVQTVIDFLETVGDSIVAFQTGTVVKIHVHTMTPYKVLEFCQKYGEFLTVKIENMTLQHNETAGEKKKEETEYKRVRPHTAFATVVVADGKGLTETFAEMGADVVIDGGQGNNPSIERFIQAFDEANADVIFVFPNNKNIIMAAKQAKDIYKKSEIRVIESRNFGEAYSALSMLDYSSCDADQIQAAFYESMENASCGMITRAVRTTSVGGVAIQEGDYIGFTDRDMLVSVPDKVQAFFDLADKLETAEKSFLIAVYGAGATDEERACVAETAMQKYPTVEFYELDGGQDVYDFILIIE